MGKCDLLKATTNFAMARSRTRDPLVRSPRRQPLRPLRLKKSHFSTSIIPGAQWRGGKRFGLRIQRSGVRATLGTPCCVLEQSNAYLPLKVLVIPRKRLLRHIMTKNCLTGRSALNKTKPNFHETSNQTKPNQTSISPKLYIVLTPFLSLLGVFVYDNDYIQERNKI